MKEFKNITMTAEYKRSRSSVPQITGFRTLFCIIMLGLLPQLAISQEIPNMDKMNLVSNFELNDSIRVVPDYIELQTKAYTDSVVLRWVPNSRIYWEKVQKTGFVVIRLRHHLEAGFERKRKLDSLYQAGDSKGLMKLQELDAAEKAKGYQIDTIYLATYDQPVKPYDSAQWVPRIPEMDDYARVAAAATLGGLDVGDDAGFARKAQQENSLFGITLMAADFSALAADGLGLRFVDKTVELGKFYEYIVLPADPIFQQPVQKMDSATQFRYNSLLANQDGRVGYNGKEPNSSVFDLKAYGGEHTVKLRWPVYQNRFSGYWVLRSEDGGVTFDSLNQRVYIPQQKQESTGPALYEFKDSVAYNYVPYMYRLIAIDEFAEFSDPVDISAMGKDLTPPKNPILKSANYLNSEQMIELSWEISEVSDVAQFNLIHASDHDFSENVSTTSLNKNDTSFLFQPQAEAYFHYFKLEASDTSRNMSDSHPLFVHISDTIPPATPQNLRAEIDTTGQVVIQWSDVSNEEQGFLGYRVYYGNHPKHEFTQLTVKPNKSTTYEYQIPVNTLTESIYYKVQAVDGHYNHSAFSEVLKATKPDKIAPVSPVFNRPKSTKDYISLSWSPSSSKDVVEQTITRSLVGTEEVVQFQLDVKTSSYNDTTAVKGKLYEYSLMAVDDANLSSDPSFPVRAQVIHAKQSAGVDEVRIDYAVDKKEVLLEWFHELKGDFRFVVYRGFREENVKRYKTIEPTTNAIRDVVRQPGKYTYAIKVVHKDGTKSLLSETVSIEAN